MRKTFQYKGCSVSYQSGGKGKTVMLVHGFAEDGRIWDEQAPVLKQHCRLIIPDLPGSGHSGYNDTLNSIEDYADCLHELLKVENVEHCIILGHSLGGYITLAFAEKYGEKLSGYGFIHSTAFADSEEKKQNRLKGIKMIGEYGSYAFIKSTTPNLFSVRFKEKFAEKIDALIKNGVNFKKEALQQYYYAMMVRPDRTHVLRNTSIPVLFVAGTEDIAAPLGDVLQQMYLPKTSYIHILQNTAHMSMWEATEAVNKHVSIFIEDVEK